MTDIAMLDEQISAALYDASLVALHRQWAHADDFKGAADAIKVRLNEEFANEHSGPVLTGQGNTAQAVKDRISLLETIMLEGAGVS
jgi:hypothetical protein